MLDPTPDPSSPTAAIAALRGRDGPSRGERLARARSSRRQWRRSRRRRRPMGARRRGAAGPCAAIAAPGPSRAGPRGAEG